MLTTSKKVSETISNRFLDQVEEKYLGKNPIKRFFSKLKFNKFCKETMKASPSFGVLWFFADFIKLAERVYFFNNNKEGSLFSSKSYSIGENGFIINDKENSIKLIVVLNSDLQRVQLEIKRLNGTSMTTEHAFVNNAWTDNREKYDEVLIDNIIGIINSHMVALLKWCWEKKGTFDNYAKSIS